jgi:hypothetical protein
MRPAFPTSDYYGDSVAMRVAPFRQSRDPCAVDVQDGLGAPFVPLMSLEATLLPRSVRKANRSSTFPAGGLRAPDFEEAPDVSRCIRSGRFTERALGFRQFSFHHAVRVSTGMQLSGFTAPRLSEHAVFPFGCFASG